VHNGGLNVLAHFLEGCFEGRFSVDLVHSCYLSEQGDELHTGVIVLFDLLAENRACYVAGLLLAVLDHTFLAGVLAALKDEDVRRGNSVFYEELGLECILGEVFE